MNIFNYDQVTGEYLGASVADESPLEPGEFLIPANSTPAAPMEVKPGYAAVFSDGVWIEVVDLRGTTYWIDGVRSVMTQLGELPVGAVTNEPVKTESANDVIKTQIATLEATITPRRLREAILGTDNGWLADIETQIEELRRKLV